MKLTEMVMMSGQHSKCCVFPLPAHLSTEFSLPQNGFGNPCSSSRLISRCCVGSACLAAVFLPHFQDECRPSLQGGRKLARLLDCHDASVHTQSVSYSSDDSDWESDDESYRQLENVLDFSLQSSRKAFNALDFARIYDIAALRVPAAECRDIANRLRGHLLNWPRIRNVARVEGDDLDGDISSLIGNDKDEKENDPYSVLKAVYGAKEPSGVLSERIRVIENFRRKGSRQFPCLDRISRPKSKGLKENRRDKDNATKYFKDKLYTVQIAKERLVCNPNGKEEPSLVNMGFGMKKWIGPTRLLLLDSRYAGKPASELPMAVQVLLNGAGVRNKGHPRREIVPCNLILFYDYWSTDEILNDLLTKGVTIPSAYENVGQIALLSLRDEHLPHKHHIAKVIFDKERSKIKTVVNETDSIKSQFCTLQLEVLAGNHSLVTTVIEYWNSKLAAERRRLIEGFNEKDVVCDVFAGVGPLAVAAAKKVWRVFANDLNPHALKYLAKNVSENRLLAKVEMYNLDGRTFLKQLLGFDKPVPMTQVVMDLPTDAEKFLDAFIGAFNPCTWNAKRPMPYIHVYGFSSLLDPEADFLERIVCKIGHAPEHIEMHRVYLAAPGKWMLCASFQLPHTVAFKDRSPL